ncbi:MAG: A24 family peptidase [Acidimicrobiaceae bacterium]|nr:A24 family peptidase [Acidimicrobiaceae bacterium]
MLVLSAQLLLVSFAGLWQESSIFLLSSGLVGFAVGCFAVRIADWYTLPACDCTRQGHHASKPPRRFPSTVSKRVLTCLTVSALFVAVAARFGFEWEAIPPFLAATALVVLSLVDLRSYRLPDVVVFTALVVGAAVIFLLSLFIGDIRVLLIVVAASLGCALLMSLVYAVNPGGLGFGDVKLSLLLGLHLGWVAATFHQSWLAAVVLVLHALLISSCVGVLMGVVVVMLRRLGYNVLPDPTKTVVCPKLAAADKAMTINTRASRIASGLAANTSRHAIRSKAKTATANTTTDQAVDTVTSQPVDTAFPFGPALAAGTLIAVLFSETLLDAML